MSTGTFHLVSMCSPQLIPVLTLKKYYHQRSINKAQTIQIIHFRLTKLLSTLVMLIENNFVNYLSADIGVEGRRSAGGKLYFPWRWLTLIVTNRESYAMSKRSRPSLLAWQFSQLFWWAFIHTNDNLVKSSLPIWKRNWILNSSQMFIPHLYFSHFIFIHDTVQRFITWSLVIRFFGVNSAGFHSYP